MNSRHELVAFIGIEFQSKLILASWEGAALGGIFTPTITRCAINPIPTFFSLRAENEIASRNYGIHPMEAV